jgi:putative hemolysin
LLSADDSLEQALVAAHHDMHTRFPVTEIAGDPQRIIGYVNFKDIVSCLRFSPQEPSLRGIMRPLPSFDGDATVAHCLEKLIRDHGHIALVRDPHGTILGMITIEDIVEELVGEIYDEYDHLPHYIIPAGNGWIVGGNASLARVLEATGIALLGPAEKPASTLNEWAIGQLGRPPKGGDVLTTDGARLLVRKVRRQLLLEAHLSRGTSPSVDTRD